MNKGEFASLVKKSRTYTEILLAFGLMNKGHNYRTMQKRILEDEIDDSHIRNYHPSSFRTKIPLIEILVEESTYSRTNLKRRLMEGGIIKNKCQICHLLPEWNGSPLTLRLDHINGKPNDNRIENLRLICANCDSQLSTYAGRNKPHRHICMDCGEKASKGAIRCMNCYALSQRRVSRPSHSILKKEVEENGFSAVGRKYGVSDNAIRKWLRK
jgi:hypothetical protein